MTTAQKRVIAAARAWREAIRVHDEPCVVDIHQVMACTETLADAIDAFDREQRLIELAKAENGSILSVGGLLNAGASAITAFDREQQIPNISCDECMHLSFDSHHWEYARRHGHHPMCSTQQQPADVCECGHKRCDHIFDGCVHRGCVHTDDCGRMCHCSEFSSKRG